MDKIISDHITIVLVNPKTSANIGSVARAMNCMGLRNLAVVSPRCQIDRDAFSLAVGSDEILQSALIIDDLKSFLKNFSFIVGTTKKMGKRRLNFITASEFASKHLPLHLQSKTAILFGAEDYGLSMESVKLCQHLVYIPVSNKFGSLNLSQAVMIICYEIRKAFERKVFLQGREEADSDDMERLSRMIDETFEIVAYPEAFGAFSYSSHLKEILSRARLKKFEVHMLFGMARHAKYLSSLAFKKDNP